MAFLVKKDKAFNPVDISFFSSKTKMPTTADD